MHDANNFTFKGLEFPESFNVNLNVGLDNAAKFRHPFGCHPPASNANEYAATLLVMRVK